MVSISDRQIVFSSILRLPIINMEVPLIGFFVITSILAAFFFVYLQLCVMKAKILSKLLNSRHNGEETLFFHSWVMGTTAVNIKIIDKFIHLTVGIFLWASLPAALLLTAFRFMKRHDPIWSYIVGMMPVLCTLVVLYVVGRFKRQKLLYAGQDLRTLRPESQSHRALQ